MIMEFLDNAICPISNVKVDSHISRLTVFLNASLLALYLVTGIPLFIGIVAIDYAIRAIGNPKYSPLKWIAATIINLAGRSPKMVDQAPKLFAARVGLLFAAMSVALMPMNTTASFIVGGILLVFTVLDSVFDFCVGCITYAYVVLPFYKWRGVR
jgi:Domain of unknown function (DUF4395)